MRWTSWMGSLTLVLATGCTPEGSLETAETVDEASPQPIAEAEAFAIVELFSSEG